MAKFIATIKAIITRVVFAAHGFLGIWQVTIFKKNQFYWYLCSPILLLFFEGVFTLTIKENQEWKWFCPSVFLYLSSIVPAIWLLELDKVDKRMKAKEELELPINFTASTQFKDLHNLIGVGIKLPVEISLTTETWITLIEQFLMLILIIGRWMLPKGDLTRDQLSQLLLVYIGTAADIIEFFDSFKDDKIASEPILVLLTLGIWSWSLMQFTVVLTATKSRKSRLTSTKSTIKKSESCCTIDVWGIALNITLQDAPFLVFRLLLITHFQIISYMNVFFTCKNTLVILLQLYRLYVVYSEHNKKHHKKNNVQLTNVAVISKDGVNLSPDYYYKRDRKHAAKTNKQKQPKVKVSHDNSSTSSSSSSSSSSSTSTSEEDNNEEIIITNKHEQKKKRADTSLNEQRKHRHKSKNCNEFQNKTASAHKLTNTDKLSHKKHQAIKKLLEIKEDDDNIVSDNAIKKKNRSNGTAGRNSKKPPVKKHHTANRKPSKSSTSMSMSGSGLSSSE